jgi:purine-cytosine permease-like protein
METCYGRRAAISETHPIMVPNLAMSKREMSNRLSKISHARYRQIFGTISCEELSFVGSFSGFVLMLSVFLTPMPLN